jgi:hypothetical protein
MARTWANLEDGRRGRQRKPVDEAGRHRRREWVNVALALVDGVHTLVWSRRAAKAD